MNDMLFIIILFWILTCSGSIFGVILDNTLFNLTPKDIENISNLNIFGSTCVFILLIILNPFIFILKFLYYITHAKINKNNKKEEI